MQQLSVLIPTYNDASLLPETLAPLLRDPATGEVLVVVDGSCDGSYKLLTDIARRDDRVRPFWIENRGHVGARQYGFEHARHDVLLMLDADVVASDGLVSGHAAWHERGAGLWMGNVSVGRRALLAAGGFDGGAGLRYCDDNELGLRLAQTDVA